MVLKRKFVKYDFKYCMMQTSDFVVHSVWLVLQEDPLAAKKQQNTYFVKIDKFF